MSIFGRRREQNFYGDVALSPIAPSTHRKREVYDSRVYAFSIETRNTVKKRADGYCEGCGDPTRYVELHHIVPIDIIKQLTEGVRNKIGKEFASQHNCAQLCKLCHLSVHNGAWAELNSGYYNDYIALFLRRKPEEVLRLFANDQILVNRKRYMQTNGRPRR